MKATLKYSLSIAVAILVSAFGVTAAAYANLLTNPGFENPPPRSDGDFYIGSNSGNMANWSIQGGLSVNVVQVDGAGGFTYNAGPENDASTVAAGQPQRYVDFATGNISIHQSFIAKCTANFRFGASFSNRVGQAGIGNTAIVTGNVPTGAALATSPTISISAGNTTYAWQVSSGSANLIVGQTYTFKIQMSQDYMNADSAFVEQVGECVEPPVDVPGDHYQCYRAEGPILKPETIMIADQFGKAQVVLGRPELVCNPSIKRHGIKTYQVENQKRHLICYSLVKQSDQPRRRRVKTANQFTSANLLTNERRLFCVPSLKNLIGENEIPIDKMD